MPALHHRIAAPSLLTTLLAGPSTAQPLPAADALQPVAWLAGCWARRDADAGSIEHWMPPAGGTMFGMARTLKAGRTIEHEFLELRAQPDGAVVYTAHPSGQKTTSFRLVRHSSDELVFENPEHDFPQRVLYRRDGEGMTARIEGMRNGRLRGIDFPFRRC